jgi:hypothetical protein
MKARPRGFEPGDSPVLSDVYKNIDVDGRDATRPADASEHVSTDAHGNDVPQSKPLPPLTPDLFIAAGSVAAERVSQEPTAGSRLEEILQRVVGHCAVLGRY